MNEQTVADPRREFQERFVQWQSKMPNVVKTRQGHHYLYVGLSELLQASLPVLSSVGLTLHHETELRDGKFIVRAILGSTGAHGFYLYTEYPIELSSVQADVGAIKTGPKGERRESMNAIQAQGSALTYARRYTAMCILGITDGLDFDAADVVTTEPAATEPAATEPDAPAEGIWDDECAGWVSSIAAADTVEESRKRWSAAVKELTSVVEKGDLWSAYHGKLIAAGQRCKVRIENDGEVPW